jgi:hypothetical protein
MKCKLHAGPPGASRDVSIGTNSFLGSIQTDNTQNIRVTGELEEE